jgi:hypothetical protein
MGRNTAVTKLVIRDSVMSRENFQQLKSMLRRNTALESLDLESSALGSAGLAEIAPVLYRNTSIKSLDLRNDDLDDIESDNVLRELRRLQAFLLLVAIQPFSSLISADVDWTIKAFQF